ncbi:TPA: hypothetical protein U5341_000876 [Yersinia enterocolitica]|nr:hypothetical protein [Yersinia enterocolitica]
MSIASTDIVNAAYGCLGQDTEAGYRSCISRSYYGMYHEAMSSLTHVPHFSSNHHGNLIGYMTNTAECKNELYETKRLKLLGYSLKQMRDARNEADYHISEVTVSKEMAETGLESANLFLNKWAELREAKAS